MSMGIYIPNDGWVPVGRMLPPTVPCAVEYNPCVLILCQDGRMGVQERRYVCQYWELDLITHWMDLPARPEVAPPAGASCAPIDFNSRMTASIPGRVERYSYRGFSAWTTPCVPTPCNPTAGSNAIDPEKLALAQLEKSSYPPIALAIPELSPEDERRANKARAWMDLQIDQLRPFPVTVDNNFGTAIADSKPDLEHPGEHLVGVVVGGLPAEIRPLPRTQSPMIAGVCAIPTTISFGYSESPSSPQMISCSVGPMGPDSRITKINGHALPEPIDLKAGERVTLNLQTNEVVVRGKSGLPAEPSPSFDRVVAAARREGARLVEHDRKNCPDCCMGLTAWLPCERHRTENPS